MFKYLFFTFPYGFFLILVLHPSVQCFSIEIGQCKIFRNPIFIDPSQLLGDWFQTHSADDIGSMTCVKLHLSLTNDSSLGLHYDWRNSDNSSRHHIHGIAEAEETDKYNIFITEPQQSNMSIQIAGVQYNQYLLLFNCQNLNSSHFSEQVYVFSRTMHLHASAETAINIFSNYSKLNAVQQDDNICNSSGVISILNIIFVTMVAVILSKH